MFERLDELEQEFLALEARLGDPDLIADQPRYQQAAKRYRELEPIVARTRALRGRREDLATAQEMLAAASGDERELARDELTEAEADIERLTAELRVLQLLPTHLSVGEIADRLYVSRNTVKSQTIAIYRKLGTSSRGGAVEIATAAGLLADAAQHR